MGIQALIADSHEMFRRGLKLLLLDALGASLVLEACSFEQALAMLCAQGPGELLLMDLGMSDNSGVQTLGMLRDSFPETKLVVVSASEDHAEILMALSAGAHGYIPKTLNADEIVAALKSVLEGRIFAPNMISRREAVHGRGQPSSHPSDNLTARQRQVLEELLKGRASKEIARTLGVSEGTIKVHVGAIYRALGVRSRSEAIVKCGPVS